MEKCIWLEVNTKFGINQEHTNIVTNNTVSLFDWSILMRGIGSSRGDFTVMIGKDVEDIMIRI